MKQMLTKSIIMISIILIAGCTPKNPARPPVNTTQAKLFVVGSDFQSGILKWLTIDNNTFEADSLTIHQDSRLLTYGSFVYVIERFGADNILKYDPTKSGTAGVVYQKHLGDNWNPKDIAFVNDTKAYISLENEPKILVFNPSTGEVLSNISTADYIYTPPKDSGTAATSPHAGMMAIDNNILYVVLQRRNGDWMFSGGQGVILRINIQTNAVLDTIQTVYKNPGSIFIQGGKIYIATSGKIGTTGDGAIEVIDIATKAKSTAIDENALGGEPSDFVHLSGTKYYILTYVGWGNVQVKLVDFSTGTVEATVPNVTDAFGGIIYDSVSKKLFVGEKDATNSGVKVFDENNTLVAGPVVMNLPPAAFTILRN